MRYGSLKTKSNLSLPSLINRNCLMRTRMSCGVRVGMAILLASRLAGRCLTGLWDLAFLRGRTSEQCFSRETKQEIYDFPEEQAD